MRAWLTAGVACIGMLCAPAFAQRIDTPILSLAETSVPHMAFSLVSQSATVTEFRLEGLPSPMQGEIVAPPGGTPVSRSAHARQTFALSIDPRYDLRLIDFAVDASIGIVGAGYTGNRTSYTMSALLDGAVGGQALAEVTGGSGGGRWVSHASLFFPEGFEQPNELEIGLDLSAVIAAASAPWLTGSGSFQTHGISLFIFTTQIVPVPEPHTAAMMLAGLLLVGVRRRRT